MWRRFSTYIIIIGFMLNACAANTSSTAIQLMHASPVATVANVSAGFEPQRDGFSFKNFFIVIHII